MGLYDQCKKNVPLSTLSTFGIGGVAEWVCIATTSEELQKVLSFVASEQCPFLVIGRGSNCLFSDDGFSGIIIQNRVETVDTIDDGTFVVSSGASFSSFGVKAAQDGWGGLEFAVGIPGSVGGAILMNASAQHQQTADAVVWVEYLDEKGSLIRLGKDELSFGYRQSIFQTMKGVITSVCFQLKRDEMASRRQREMMEYRRRTQPYKEKSCGCVFRNPPGMSAGQLIEEAGLKGKQIGGAQVSPMHANFIVNKGGATAHDVIQLMNHITEVVAGSSGVVLEHELCIIPSK